MAQGRTDAYGHFTLEGHTAEFTTIDPKVNIYHKCEHKKDAIDTFGVAVKVASSGALT
uniref:Phage tail protein n=1 Tax=Ascaris lumbricoides TaxID=6252 RepID=A0A0M3HKC6_ASCLU